MSDIIELPNSVVSFVDYHSAELLPPRILSASDDGLLAILTPNHLLIGVIGCDPTNQNKKYSFNPEKITVDFTHGIIIKVADFDFKQSIKNQSIDDNVIYNLLFDTDFTVAYSNGKLPEHNNIEWSPLDVFTNKTFLAISRYDCRTIILGFNSISNCWEKEFDITDLYFNYYKDNLLKSQLERNVVYCTDANEYIELKNDLKLVDFSWSKLVREYGSQQYCLLTTLSISGIITVFRVIVDQINSSCEVLYCERLNDADIKPLNIKFCDISETSFLIIIIDSKDLVKSYPFCLEENDLLTMKSLSPPFIINQQTRHCQKSKIQWSMELSQLIIGFQWKLLISKIITTDGSKFSTESAMLYLPSNSEISGLYIKNNNAYVTSIDGFFFGIKLSSSVINLELSQIRFENTSLIGGDNEFMDVFVSPNSIYLGFLKISNDLTSTYKKFIANIVIVCLVSECQTLNILMNDNIPFSRKQDAVEEIRHLYCSSKEGLRESLNNIGASEIQWGNCSLHKLLLIRYICIFFGYKLNASHEFIASSNKYKFEEIEKIRKLETIIILKNISYWLDGFCEMDNSEIQMSDCLFVLRIIRKLELLTDNYILETIETSKSRCIKVMKKKFHVHESELKVLKDVTEDITCIICGEICQFNLFVIKCPKNHVFARCCKSLEVCADTFKICQMCGAIEKIVKVKDLSNWMMEIVHSNCPLCDGKLLISKF